MSQLSLPLVDPSEAPEPVAAVLAGVRSRYGFVPNLYRVFAHAPPTLDAYLALSAQFGATTLSATERNVVLLAASRANGCTYCVAVHSTVADMQRDDPAVTEAIRAGAPIADSRLEALRRLTQALVEERGHAGDTIQRFLAAGFRQEQVLEVVLGIAMKTLSNYTNHLAEPPLDEAFAARAFGASHP